MESNITNPQIFLHMLRLKFLLYGTEQDREIVNKFVAELKEEVPYINLIGKTSIKEFIGLIGKADLVITNDTSTYHIAVMQKRKTCVITGGMYMIRLLIINVKNMAIRNRKSYIRKSHV